MLYSLNLLSDVFGLNDKVARSQHAFGFLGGLALYCHKVLYKSYKNLRITRLITRKYVAHSSLQYVCRRSSTRCNSSQINMSGQHRRVVQIQSNDGYLERYDARKVHIGGENSVFSIHSYLTYTKAPAHASIQAHTSEGAQGHTQYYV